jgi:hypothetical protein
MMVEGFSSTKGRVGKKKREEWRKRKFKARVKLYYMTGAFE